MHISGRQGWTLLLLWLGLFPARILPDAADTYMIFECAYL